MNHISVFHIEFVYQWLAIFTWRATLLLLATTGLQLLLRPAAPAVRLLAWKLCLCGALALLFLSGLTASSIAFGRPALAESPVTNVLVVWLAGAAICVCMSIVPLIRSYLLVRSSQPVVLSSIIGRWRRASKLAGMTEVGSLRSSAKARIAFCWGIRRPALVLPKKMLDLPQADLDVVLTEQAVRRSRRDWPSRCIMRLTTTLLWFHPLAWYAALDARRAWLRAIDESLLRLGTDPFRYANLLYQLHQRDDAPLRRLAQFFKLGSALERRMMAVLYRPPHLREPTASRAAAMAIASGLFVVGAAVFEPHADLQKLACIFTGSDGVVHCAANGSVTPAGHESVPRASGRQTVMSDSSQPRIINLKDYGSRGNACQYALLKTRQLSARSDTDRLAFMNAVSDPRSRAEPQAVSQIGMHLAESDLRSVCLELSLSLKARKVRNVNSRAASEVRL